MPENIHNEVTMQQNTSSCQLSSAEKRILAEAELQSQQKRLHALLAECAEAQRRMRRAERILAEVES